MSLFKLMAQSCGLSLSETVAYLGTKPDTTKSWWIGRRKPPEMVLEQLTELAVRQDLAAQKALVDMGLLTPKPDRVTLPLCASDSAARKLGWPCLNAYRAVIRRIIEKMPPKLATRLVLVTEGRSARIRVGR